MGPYDLIFDILKFFSVIRFDSLTAVILRKQSDRRISDKVKIIQPVTQSQAIENESWKLLNLYVFPACAGMNRFPEAIQFRMVERCF